MLRRVYRKIYQLVVGKIDPVSYARKIGVNMPKSGFYAYGRINWGTEPWIITIGNNVHITNNVNFITHDGGTLLFRDRIPDLEYTAPIVVKDNVYIGNNVIILPGVTIGANVVIGAGAIVTKDIPDNSVAVGVPAKAIESIDDYLKKLEKKSLHLGHLKGQDKDRALMEFYHYEGESKGIYF